ncbi:hypothetical protein JMJ77_0005299 [Colletotrichum scovillei]|uniref:Uncharacterized protein n=1 Tax=Colletotrichum scovillei TaxID=1209932 RepID=A0A9P7RG81_9PEZI|nr:hypothetical protein JMJ77_0005299 [Colletotrichum scovillei]KAG7076463.1 hypothetical protein JMJ76_0013727 [Colletotrichum scovillei]KAG7083665.1 hypothetical protein JMJ78_0009108 [Colletotrichum scovillei]
MHRFRATHWRAQFQMMSYPVAIAILLSCPWPMTRSGTHSRAANEGFHTRILLGRWVPAS